MAKAKSEQVWIARLDEDAMCVEFITRADGVVRQTFQVADINEVHRNRLLLRGLKVTLEERTSAIHGAQIQAKMAGRQSYADLWETEEWTKARVGGGFTVSIHFDAIAMVKGCKVQDVRDAWTELDDDTRQGIIDSEEVQAAIKTIEEQTVEAGTLDLAALIK
jgi:hypothetical protein